MLDRYAFPVEEAKQMSSHRHPSGQHEGKGEIPLRLGFEQAGRRIMTFEDGIPLLVTDVKGRQKRAYPDFAVAVNPWVLICDDGSIHLHDPKQIDEDIFQRQRLQELRIKTFSFQHEYEVTPRKSQRALAAFLEWEEKATRLETINLELR